MNAYAKYQQYQLAEAAFALGARRPVVKHETDLSRRDVDAMARAVPNARLSKGLLPDSVDWYLHYAHNVHASLLADRYLTRWCADRPRLAVLIDSYIDYREQAADAGEPSMDFTRAWVLVRYIDCGVLALFPCPRCGIGHLDYAVNRDLRSPCGLCRLDVVHVDPRQRHRVALLQALTGRETDCAVSA